MIWPYIVDFYCKELELIIEIDWETHNYKQEYDEKRIKYLKSLWLEILVYSDEQVLKNLEWVCEDINWQVKARKKIKLVENTSPRGGGPRSGSGGYPLSFASLNSSPKGAILL